jgi:hypothetical protein
MKIFIGRFKPSPACIIALCTHSPASKRITSGPRFTAMEVSPLFLVGTDEEVPRKMTLS